MKHCYIFDYNANSILHTEIPDDLFFTEDIENYLIDKYNISSDEIDFMTSNKPLNIEEL